LKGDFHRASTNHYLIRTMPRPFTMPQGWRILVLKKGDEVSMFMLGKGVLFEKCGSEEFDVMGQINKFEGDFYV